jgi:two-component system KDP operon response regulator KdpE
VHALLVCDDIEETALLRFVLQQAGLTVATASGLESGLSTLSERPADLLVLATRAGSPRSQVLRARRDSEAPLLVVTNVADEDEQVQVYEAGADLVAARPYSARLLSMQARALLRRGRGGAPAAMPTFAVGSLRLDPSARMVQVGTRPPRRLTQLEFRLLYTLMLFPGQTVATETIVERVWGFDGAGGMELVRGLVRRLRGKVEQDPKRPQFILTEPGIGYRLGADVE